MAGGDSLRVDVSESDEAAAGALFLDVNYTFRFGCGLTEHASI